jgi:hypothetical protein
VAYRRQRTRARDLATARCRSTWTYSRLSAQVVLAHFALSAPLPRLLSIVPHMLDVRYRLSHLLRQCDRMVLRDRCEYLPHLVLTLLTLHGQAIRGNVACGVRFGCAASRVQRRSCGSYQRWRVRVWMRRVLGRCSAPVQLRRPRQVVGRSRPAQSGPPARNQLGADFHQLPGLENLSTGDYTTMSLVSGVAGEIDS